jgi:hypothetical protein
MPDLATHPAPEGSYDVRPLFDKLKRHLPLQAIEAALKATDSASERERRLPMPSMVLLLLGAALFRHVSLEQLVLLLHLALPTPEALGVTSGAISHARKALGPEPLEQLFQSWAAPQAHAAASVERWRGLSLYGLDGSSLRVADTEPNRDHFGGHDGGPRGRSGYPLVRLVVLMALRSHLLAAAAFGPFSLGEFTLAQALWAQLPADSLIVLDRNFYSAAVLLGIERIGPARHWLLRLKGNIRFRTLQVLAPGDLLVEVKVSPEARKKDPSLPTHFIARVISYRIRGFRPQKLMTSLLDPKSYPASEMIALYHERWEVELGLDEKKTEMLERRETLRSKKPRLVEQEVWAVRLSYTLLRREAVEVAKRAHVPAVRVSFAALLQRMRVLWLVWAWTGPDGRVLELERLEQTVEGLILPKRRSERSYPRAVKRKMSSYAKSRPQPKLHPAEAYAKKMQARARKAA